MLPAGGPEEGRSSRADLNRSDFAAVDFRGAGSIQSAFHPCSEHFIASRNLRSCLSVTGSLESGCVVGVGRRVVV